MWGILFATKELGDPLTDSPQRAPCSLRLLDAVVRLLSFNGVIVDRFVAFFSAHAYLHSLARRVLSRRLLLWGIRRHQSPWWLGIRHLHSSGRFNVAYPPGRFIKTVRGRAPPGRLPPRGSHSICRESADDQIPMRQKFVSIQYERCWNRGNLGP
jgi:hypothetical protein